MAEAQATGRRLEIVAGAPPSWDDPWEGSVLAEPRKIGRGGWLLRLLGGAHLDGTGDDIFEARLTDEHPSLRRAPTPPRTR
jgi:hypothetical protein